PGELQARREEKAQKRSLHVWKSELTEIAKDVYLRYRSLPVYKYR
uniref:Histocompatibility minor HB-1 n=1 Tax=Suricata suricatta TaxID=37032 RepID=A0A673V9J5_SURSU